MSNNDVITTIPRNRIDEIQIRHSEFKGHKLVDIRIWSERGDSREHAPTKRGISLRPSELRQVIEGLEQAETDLVEQHLLEAAGA